MQMARTTNEMRVDTRNMSNKDDILNKNRQIQLEGADAAVSSSQVSNVTSIERVTPTEATTAQNDVRRQSFNKAEHKKVTQTKNELIEQSVMNEKSDTNQSQMRKVEHIAKSGNVQDVQNVKQMSEFVQSPYMIVVVNQTLANMQQTNDSKNTNNNSDERQDVKSEEVI